MLPALLPQAQIVRRALRQGRRLTVEALCRELAIECRVTGPCIKRKVYVRQASELVVEREPGAMGTVSMGLNRSGKKDQAVLALGILAYVVFDYVARESVRGLPEMKTSPPVGRPRKTRILSGAERQRRWRATHKS
jgi:hypothetical protein